MSGVAIAYFIFLNNRGGKPSEPADRLFLSLFIAAITSCSLNSIESIILLGFGIFVSASM